MNTENREGQEMAMTGEERQLRTVLSHASMPDLPEGAMERLLARIEAERPVADVIAFRPRAVRRPSLFRYAAALPLAASLALGIYLGAMGTLDFALPSALTGDVAVNIDQEDDVTGVSEAEQFAEDTLS